MTPVEPSIHATAVVVGELGVLIRGAPGSGKSALAFDLILAGRSGLIPKTTLIGDDRVRLTLRTTELIVSGVKDLAGMIEIRGLGIRRIDFLDEAGLGLVVDLDATDAERLPPPETLRTEILGISLPRIPVAKGRPALPLIIGFLTTN